MATFFKTLGEDSRTHSRTLLHESIPITSSMISGTYVKSPATDSLNGRSQNIKTYSHGMFQSVYDYPYASSSANHIFDITVGLSPSVPAVTPATHGTLFQGMYTTSDALFNLAVSASSLAVAKKKRSIYNQMSQQLVGYDPAGNVRFFDSDGNFSTPGDKMLDPIFINFSRLLVKDEIKKGSFTLSLGVNMSGSSLKIFDKKMIVSDAGAETNYKVNSPAGEYGILVATNEKDLQGGMGGTVASTNGSPTGNGNAAIDSSKTGTDLNVGLIYYQAGIVVLDGSKCFTTAFGAPIEGDPDSNPPGEMADRDGILTNPTKMTSPVGADKNYQEHFLTGSINTMADFVRNRISNISFSNTTELNSTIYFCRANHNEFNYSSNLTYLDGSKVRVKGNEPDELPKTYVTTVGLYAADNELLAVAKLSEPLRKDPTNELTLRVRLDY